MGCVSQTGTGGECANGRALSDAFDVAVSPDGANVYVAATLGGIAIFDRNLVTGELTQKAMTAGAFRLLPPPGCAVGVAIGSPTSPAASPDGRNVQLLGLEHRSHDLRPRRLDRSPDAEGVDGGMRERQPRRVHRWRGVREPERRGAESRRAERLRHHLHE